MDPGSSFGTIQIPGTTVEFEGLNGATLGTLGGVAVILLGAADVVSVVELTLDPQISAALAPASALGTVLHGLRQRDHFTLVQEDRHLCCGLPTQSALVQAGDDDGPLMVVACGVIEREPHRFTVVQLQTALTIEHAIVTYQGTMAAVRLL